MEKTGIDKKKLRFCAGNYNLSSGADACSAYQCIYFGNSFFNLEHNKQEFTAAHELIHYQKKDYVKGILARIFIPSAVYVSLHGCSYMADLAITTFAPENRLLKMGKKVADAFVFKHFASHAFLIKYFAKKYSYHKEKEADLGAAIALDSANGGIQWLNDLIKKEKEDARKSNKSKIGLANSYQATSHKPILSFEDWLELRYGFHYHPPHEERLKYLQEWQKKHNPTPYPGIQHCRAANKNSLQFTTLQLAFKNID